ncbi:futalosine hydrolase [Streptomyces sp. QHH-9511]|uniref:futalosine hydrolase n=1 Tax=Streptomyces sp. QHH-9511 TaxID=2684468 RepID=UPI0013175EE3|nr:futalosine hydrolase [Streptomyces sp. QHH-9511]QGZ50233.1 futalosine hydrolase [Streptomyces sp. QHH-9511]
MTHRILIVTAVAAEADSVARGLPFGGPGSGELPLPGGFRLRRHADTLPLPGGAPRGPEPRAVVDVLVGGVGPAAAAVATATALAAAALAAASRADTLRATPYDLVVSAGIAGGFQPLAPLGSVVVSDTIVAADLGAQTPDAYLAVEELGFGRSTHPVPARLTERISRALGEGVQRHTVAPVLTVSTVTGTAERATELANRHPGAAAEAMEGFGVAEAAAAYGVPVVEIRAVSNAVGPRDRGAWRIGQAMDSLRYTFQLLSNTLFVEPAP